MSRIGQIALTVNGECCPVASSSFRGLAAIQRTFELEGGTARGVPGVEQFPDVDAIFARAHEWLHEVHGQLISQGLHAKDHSA